MNETKLTADDLSQEIRRVDGNHDLGAGVLAEKLFEFIAGKQPTPAETLDRESIRNAALEDAARECERIAFDVTETGVKVGAEICANSIESLKSQPAQPSDSQAEISDGGDE